MNSARRRGAEHHVDEERLPQRHEPVHPVATRDRSPLHPSRGRSSGERGGRRLEKSRRDPNVRRLQEELSEKLGAPVEIQHSGSGKGKVVVTYHSLDELDGILAHIK